jgi:predicted nucleotidyltransferase
MIGPSELQPDRNIIVQPDGDQGALRMARANKPVTRVSAERILRTLLARAEAVNERPELAHRVESIIVFGSYLLGAERLNDLDVAIELKAKWQDDASITSLRQASVERAQASGRRFRNL